MISLLPITANLAPNVPLPFSGIGGAPPYTYAVLGGGAGGTINAATGLYTAPAVTGVDTIQVTDSLLAVATQQVFIGSPVQLLCDIIQTEMALANGRVYLWDQKINSPSDAGLFIAVSVLTQKTIGNVSRIDDGTQKQYVSTCATVQIDIISRDMSAFDRQQELLMALKSQYSEQQQQLNSFRIFGLPQNFVNLSEIDGGAIPYRFSISLNLMYSVVKIKGVPYYDTFLTPTVVTEP